MQLKQMHKLFLAAILAVGIWPGQSGAQNLDLNETAALLVFPVVTGGQPANIMSTTGDVVIDTNRASTLVTITNANNSVNALLLIDVISGDIGQDAWKSQSYRCFMTPRETTTFVFSPAGPGNSSLHAECGDIDVEAGVIVGVDTDGREIRQTTRAQNGFMVVSVAMADGTALGDDVVIAEDQIFGDAVVVDPNGQAYSFGALSFQALGANNGDKAYEFGTEYETLPSVLISNFIAEGPSNNVNAELILVTLDGRVGGAVTPFVSLAGNVYDDDENSQDWQYQFDCFDIVPLSEISDSFIYDPGNFNLQSPTGHFDFSSITETAEGDVHDAAFKPWGNGDDFRNRGVHGWIVQNVDGVLLNANTPIGGVAAISTDNEAAWARTLLQSNTGLVSESAGDVPTLDASGAP